MSRERHKRQHHQNPVHASLERVGRTQTPPVAANFGGEVPSPDSTDQPVDKRAARDETSAHSLKMMTVHGPVHPTMPAHFPNSFMSHDPQSGYNPWLSPTPSGYKSPTPSGYKSLDLLHPSKSEDLEIDKDSGLGSVENTVPLSVSPSPTMDYSLQSPQSPSCSTKPHSPGPEGTMSRATVGQARRKAGGLSGRSIEEEVCLICGDRASGYHYNALSCEGCKGFFRRSITRGQTYQCKFNSSCEMDMWMRRRCQACRLRRCREVGMKEECLLSDDQCRARDVRRKSRVKGPKPTSMAVITVDSEVQPSQSDGNRGNDTVDTSIIPTDTTCHQEANPLEYVTDEHRELIETIVYYQDKYELPTQEDIDKVSKIQVCQEGRPKEMTESMYKIVAEMTILTTELVVEFAKHLPGFTKICRDDQIVLLKGSASEVMILRTARRYDLESDSVILGTGMPMTKDSMRMIGLKDYGESLFHFCRQMALLGVDNAEYVLITTLSILTERPDLVDPKTIEQLHDKYLHTLIDYTQSRRCWSPCYLAKLLMKFTDLRTVSQIHAEDLYNLKLERKSLPPLLAEYFDVL